MLSTLFDPSQAMHPDKGIRLLRVAALLLLIGLAAACKPIQPPGTPTVQPGRTGVAVSVTHLAGKTVIEVVSPQGIGHATVDLPAETFPSDGLEVRLHLRGLERFSLSYAGVETGVAVAPGGTGVAAWVRQPGAAEQPITADSSFWMAVTPPPPGAADPVFIVQAPPDLLARQPTQVELAWVDFYR